MHKDEFAKVFNALDQARITAEVVHYICEDDNICIQNVKPRFDALTPVFLNEEYPLLTIRAANGEIPHGQDIANAIYQLYGPCNASSLHIIPESEHVYTQSMPTTWQGWFDLGGEILDELLYIYQNIGDSWFSDYR